MRFVKAFPASTMAAGKYTPGPGIWLDVRDGRRRLSMEMTFEEAMSLRRQLGYLIKLVQPAVSRQQKKS